MAAAVGAGDGNGDGNAGLGVWRAFGAGAPAGQAGGLYLSGGPSGRGGGRYDGDASYSSCAAGALGIAGGV